MIQSPPGSNGGMLTAMQRQLVGLYRGRPYTKAVPFNITLDGTVQKLWTPLNAYFEFAMMHIISDTAAVDCLLVDSDASAVMGRVVPDTAFYTPVDLGLAGYRSINQSNAFLGIIDPTASGAVVKGVIYGWEVTKEGNYR